MCVCPLGAFRQNRLECADPTETHREGERREGEEKWKEWEENAGERVR